MKMNLQSSNMVHILAHFIDEPKPSFPFLCLTVSGGHTQIVLVKDALDMTIIGETQDDAVGEAFDKTAKILGLPYPGGPLIDKYAKLGNPLAFEFSKPKMEGYDYSFSGLKTSILYFIQKASAVRKIKSLKLCGNILTNNGFEKIIPYLSICKMINISCNSIN